MKYDKEINPRTSQPYYANNIQEIINCLSSLNLQDNVDGILADEGKKERIYYFMDMAETQIDSNLESYYFVPLREYHQVMPNGEIVKCFPDTIRQLAVRLASALLAQSEFQQSDPNTAEIVKNLFNQTRTDLYRLSAFLQRIPGQRMKSGVSKTMPPTMQPSRNVQLQQDM